MKKEYNKKVMKNMEENRNELVDWGFIYPTLENNKKIADILNKKNAKPCSHAIQFAKIANKSIFKYIFAEAMG